MAILHVAATDLLLYVMDISVCLRMCDTSATHTAEAMRPALVDHICNSTVFFPWQFVYRTALPLSVAGVHVVVSLLTHSFASLTRKWKARIA